MTARISTAALFLMLGAQVLCPGVPGPGTLFDISDHGFRQIALVGGEYFDTERVRETFLSGAKTASHLFVISAFATRQDATLIGGKGHTEVGYEEWERMYNAGSGPESIRAIELVAIGKNAVIKVADRGRFSRRVISGSDPTLFTVGKMSCELLKLAFHRLPGSIRPDGMNPIIVNVNVRTNSVPTDEEAQNITQAIRARLNHEFTNVEIRADTWFIDDMFFPLWYPFEVKNGPRSHEEYSARGDVFCFGDDSGVRCSHASLH